MQRMTDDEMKHYIKQVERRGRALNLPRAELEKWKTEYDKISDYLNRNYKRFMVSKIVRRRAYADVAVFNAFVEAERDGLIAASAFPRPLGTCLPASTRYCRPCG